MCSCKDAKVAAVLRKVCSLFALSNIIDGHQWHGKIDSTTFGLVETAVAELLAELRPDAVPLVDAFDFSDRVSGYTHCLGHTHIHTHAHFNISPRQYAGRCHPIECASITTTDIVWLCVSGCVCIAVS